MEAKNVDIYFIPNNKNKVYGKFYNVYLNKNEQLDLAPFLNSLVDMSEFEDKIKEQYETSKTTGDTIINQANKALDMIGNIKKIKGISPNGSEKEYDAILTFNNKRNDKNYIIYTDNLYDSYGKLKVFAALYDDAKPVPFIDYPASKEEWEDICELFDKMIIENSVYN